MFVNERSMESKIKTHSHIVHKTLYELCGYVLVVYAFK